MAKSEIAPHREIPGASQKDARLTQRRKATIALDLEEARKRGQTYNQMHASEREKGRKSGLLNEDAYKAGKAYELRTPKEVRAEYDKDPQYFERAKKTKEYAKGGAVSASKRADGIAKKGKTKGKFV
jgi:hypothetical protein